MSLDKETLKVLGLITGEIVVGPVEGIDSPNGTEILIKHPYQAVGGALMPFRIKDMGQAPGAIQINPMNIIWNSPLEDFAEMHSVYLKARLEASGIKTESKPSIVI